MGKFKELINGETPVLVDFYADWCGPCKTLAPILKEVKSAFGEKLKVIKIDVDKNQKVSQFYSVKGIPTMILFKQGKILWRQSGVIPKNQIVSTIQSKV